MADQLSRFVVVLEENDGGDAELKFDVSATNKSRQEHQKILIDADVVGKMVVLADLEKVVHGTLSKGGAPATLIVVRFSFLPGRNGKRFKSAEIKLHFTKGNKGTTSPEVYKIEPEGEWGVEPMDVKTTVSHTISPSIQVGQAPATGTVGYQWQFTKNFDKKKFVRVEGARRALGRDRLKKNTAIWNLYENPETRGGIPTTLQTAILLKRAKVVGEPLGEKFNATLDIHGEPGWRGRLKEHTNKIGQAVGSLLGTLTRRDDKKEEEDGKDEEQLRTVRGSDHKGEGIIFNPTMSRGDVKDKNQLLQENLEELRQIVMVQMADDSKESADAKENAKSPDPENPKVG